MTIKLYKVIDGNRIELEESECLIYNQKAEETENQVENKFKLRLLKEIISNEILEIYPLSKQIDIIARIGEYTDEDFNNMKNFIEKK